MRIPRHWRQAERKVSGRNGREWWLQVWGWSDDSPEAAQRLAEERLNRSVTRIERGEAFDQYGYHDTPLREETIDELPGGLITRNGYGALVLNCEMAAFVDIDLPPPSLWQRLFRGGDAGVLAAARDRIERVGRGQNGFAGRLYRTPAGLRLLCTHRCYDPLSESTQRFLAELGSDPLYRKLCTAQGCFRARLTAKPWRIGIHRPASRWPHSEPDGVAAHATWCERYHAAAKGYAACRFIGTVGGDRLDPDLAQIISVHDSFACQEGAPLA